MVQFRAILTMADQQKVVYDLLNVSIFNDLEPPLPPVSRSRYSLVLNITEMVWDADIQFQWNTNRDLHTPYSTVSFRMAFSDLAEYSMTRRLHGLFATVELLVILWCTEIDGQTF